MSAARHCNTVSEPRQNDDNDRQRRPNPRLHPFELGRPAPFLPRLTGAVPFVGGFPSQGAVARVGVTAMRIAVRNVGTPTLLGLFPYIWKIFFGWRRGMKKPGCWEMQPS